MTDYVTKQVFHTKLERKKKLTVCTTLKHPIKSLENKEVLRQNVFISFRRKSKSQINVLVEQEKSPKNNNMYLLNRKTNKVIVYKVLLNPE